jgi:hypothetical protein
VSPALHAGVGSMVDAGDAATAHSGPMNRQVASARPQALPVAKPWARSPLAYPPATPGALQATDFSRLSAAFLPTGGLLAAEPLAERMRSHSAQPISKLARWIVERRVVSVQWCSRTWLPLFQFDEGLTRLRPGLQATLHELADVFSEWELAQWFASANTALGGATPADRLASQPGEVWQAARTDRFIATGG